LVKSIRIVEAKFTLVKALVTLVSLNIYLGVYSRLCSRKFSWESAFERIVGAFYLYLYYFVIKQCESYYYMNL